MKQGKGKGRGETEWGKRVKERDGGRELARETERKRPTRQSRVEMKYEKQEKK